MAVNNQTFMTNIKSPEQSIYNVLKLPSDIAIETKTPQYRVHKLAFIRDLTKIIPNIEKSIR